MKRCSACKRDRPESEFWRKNRNTTTLCSRCKTCIKAAQRIRYHADPDKFRQRQRALSLKRKLAGWKSDLTPERKLRIQKRVDKFYKDHPERQHAKTAVREAAKRGERIIRDGKASRRIKAPALLKPPYCPMCGKPTPTHKLHGHHHKGYDMPLDVLFVCQPCHAAITALERDAIYEGLPSVAGLAKFVRQQRRFSENASQQQKTDTQSEYNAVIGNRLQENRHAS